MMIARGELTGRHVLYAMIGFFGVVFLVNGTFVYFATSSWTGLETDNAYIRGLAYNRTLEAASAQDALGWDMQFDVAAPGLRSAVLTARVVNVEAAPVRGLTVAVEIRRPATDAEDRMVALEESDPGVFSGAVDLPFAGNWDMRMTARDERADLYVVERRVWIK